MSGVGTQAVIKVGRLLRKQQPRPLAPDVADDPQHRHALRRCHVVARPLRLFLTPMADQVVKRLPEGDDWTYELKVDGYRALIIRTGRESYRN